MSLPHFERRCVSQRVKWITSVAIVALAIVALMASPWRTRVAGAFERHVLGIGLVQPAEQGKPFPNLTFEALDGSTEAFVPRAGRVTFVNVFATWCPPCKAETADLANFAAAEKSRGVDVIGIDQEESPDAVNAFRSEYRIAYPVLIDTGRTTKDLLGARIIPHTIVVDGRGIIRAVVSGPMTRTEMERLAAEAAANS